MYLVIGNGSFCEGIPLCYGTTKKECEFFLRQSGYKYNSEQGLFLTKHGDDADWAKVIPLEHISKWAENKNLTGDKYNVEK